MNDPLQSLTRRAASSTTAQRRSAKPDALGSHALRDPLVQRAVSVPQSGGNPLPDAVLGQMESSFGQDFSGVRVHVGDHAPQLGALAFTQGDNVHFAPGRYDPGSSQGQRLLGHELAHVTQQRAGQVSANGQVGGVPLNDSPGLEAAADRAAERAVQAKMPDKKKKPGQMKKPEDEKKLQRKKPEDEKIGQRAVAPAQRSMNGKDEETGNQVI